MNELRYEIDLFWSEEDQAYIAEVPELAGCMADGPDYEEALRAVAVVVQQWIATPKEQRRPIPKAKHRRSAAH